MDQNQKQLVEAYKRGAGSQSHESDDQIVNRLRQENITDAHKAEEAGRRSGQPSGSRSGER